MAGGLNPPPEVLAEWAVKANYVNPETRGNGIPTMEMILLAICFAVVALRVYTRAFVTKSFGWDDALIIFNMLPLTGMAISLFLGKHILVLLFCLSADISKLYAIMVGTVMCMMCQSTCSTEPGR